MRWLGRLLASSVLSLSLVLCGFCAGASSGAKAGHDIQTAYAIGEGMAARAFATVLGSLGFSVGAYALNNNSSFDDAAQGLYDAFTSSGNVSVDPVKNACFALAASPAGVAFSNLGLTVSVLQGLVEWMQGQDFIQSSDITYPDVSVSSGSSTYSYRVLDFAHSSISSSVIGYDDLPYVPVFGSSSLSASYYPSDFSISDLSLTSSSISFYCVSSSFALTSSLPANSLWFYAIITSNASGSFSYHNLAVTSPISSSNPASVSVSINTNGYSISPYLARLLNSSYSSVGTGVSVPADSAVSGAPANVTTGSTAADAQAFADAVSANLADKTLVTDGTTINNYTYGDIVTDGAAAPDAGILDWLQENLGALQGTLEGVLEGVQAIPQAITAGVDAVLEGVQSFFQPVVDFFSPTPKTDDDFKNLVAGSGSGSHTFTQHFPFCVLNDYLSAFNSLAVQQKARAAANFTPSNFVITLPAQYKDSDGKPFKMDLTHYFTDEFYGLTMGDFSKICFSLITFIAVLSFVARLVSIADLPSNFYSNSDGGTTAVYEDDDGQTRLF